MLEIITILLIIILSPVILFAGFILLFAILGLITLILMGIAIAVISLIEWITDIF